MVDPDDPEHVRVPLVVDPDRRSRPAADQVAGYQPDLGALEVADGEPVNDREDPIAETCCGCRIALRDVLDERLEVLLRLRARRRWSPAQSCIDGLPDLLDGAAPAGAERGERLSQTLFLFIRQRRDDVHRFKRIATRGKLSKLLR
jgi:hypothetical protein